MPLLMQLRLTIAIVSSFCSCSLTQVLETSPQQLVQTMWADAAQMQAQANPFYMGDVGRLRQENERLRQEIDQWRAVAGRVASREAWAARVLQTSQAAPAAQPVSLLSAASAPVIRPPSGSHPPVMAVQQSRSFLSQESQRRAATGTTPLSYELQFLILSLGFGASLVVGGLFILSLRGSFLIPSHMRIKSESEAKEKVASLPQVLSNGLRHLGGGTSRWIEISEIHIGSMFSCREVRVHIHADRGQEHLTQTVRNADGSFIRFREAFTVEVRTSFLRGNDCPLALEVIDPTGVLADIEIPTAELLVLASRPHREYHRAELRKVTKDASGRQPYAAMRIRDVSGKAPADRGQP